MDTILIKAVQLILAFAILVIIHEFGHFFFARIFGIKVEKFYIFFNPWTQLFRWKPRKYVGAFNKVRKLKGATDADLPDNEGKADKESSAEAVEETTSDNNPKKKKRGNFWSDTEYGIGWLPLGGYCKIAGMIDESMDTEQMQQPPQDWEFRSKPAWQRMLVMIAGVLFNFLLAILIYAGIVYATGEKYVPLDKAEMGMVYSSAAKEIGFQNGDIPLTADGEKLSNPSEARMKIIQADRVQVLRNGKDTITINIPSDFMLRLDKEAKEGKESISFYAYNMPTRITMVASGEGADKGGLKKGDIIIGIDTVSTPGIYEFHNTLPAYTGKKTNFTIVRSNGERNDTLVKAVQLSDTGKIGIGMDVDPAEFYPSEEIKYSLLASIPRGIEMGTDKLVSYVKSMKMVFTKDGAKSIGGFGTLGSIFPEKWDWIAFWNIAAFISVALAFMNILPIPALDGGHVLFLLYEVITGRKPNEKFMEWAQMIGMALLILLLLYANGMDIVRLFK